MEPVSGGGQVVAEPAGADGPAAVFLLAHGQTGRQSDTRRQPYLRAPGSPRDSGTVSYSWLFIMSILKVNGPLPTGKGPIGAE